MTEKIRRILQVSVRNLLLPAILLLIGSVAQAQTIAVQDFEVVPATPTWAISAGAGNISAATGAGDTPASQRIRGGTQSWQVINGTSTLDLASVSTTGFVSVKVTVHISSTSTNTTNGADVTDTLTVAANLNGAGFPGTPDITVTGFNNARWSYNNAVNDSTPAGTPISVAGSSGTNVGTIHSTLEITIPNGTTSVALRIVALNNVIQEIWNVDDVSLTGTVITAANVGIGGRVMTAAGQGLSMATVTLTDNAGNSRTTRTSSFGYFFFDDLEAGNTYVVTVTMKQRQFTPQIITASEEATNIEFVAQE